MKNELITPANKEFVSSVIDTVSQEKGIQYTEDDLWLLVGSYVINSQRSDSDIDLILTRDNFSDDQPTRKKAPYKGIPVSISMVNKTIFQEDGLQLYGGYFTGKVLNPHQFFGGSAKIRSFVRKMAGKFIGDDAAYLGKEKRGSNAHFSAEELAAQSLLAYLAIDPEYDSYLLSYFVTEHFDLIWQFLIESITESLLLSDKVVRNDGSYKYTGGYSTYREYTKARMKSAARRWGFGVYAHDSDYRWPDSHFDNADRKIQRLDPTGTYYEEMLLFLKLTSGLDKVFF